jgi:Cyclin, C-terminal domain
MFCNIDGSTQVAIIVLRLFVLLHLEITFASYPASMIAAASIMAAARALLQQDWCDSCRLAIKLHNIISADVVRCLCIKVGVVA